LVFSAFVFFRSSPQLEEGKRVVEEVAVLRGDWLVGDHKVLGAQFVEVGVGEAPHMQEGALRMQEEVLHKQEVLLLPKPLRSSHLPLLVLFLTAVLVRCSHHYNL